MRGSSSVQRVAGDVFGGLTTAAVALPGAMGLGVVSGLGPIAGVYGTAAVSFLTSVFGGAPAQVSVVTAPMAIAMAVVVTQYASNLAEAFTIVMLAGVIQIALGVLRIGSFVAYTPYSVISGFMSGIGIIIMIVQVPPMFGAVTVPGGTLDSLRALPDAVATLNPDAFIVGAVALVVTIFWPRRVRKFLPAPLAALIVGTLVAIGWCDDAPVLGETMSGLPSLQLPKLSPAFLVNVIQPALILALIGSVNSLLTLLVTDSLIRKRHNPNRELVGQGLGNIAAGFVGGVPGAGSPLFTVLNISVGGRTALAGIVCAAVMLALALGLGKIAEPVPYAALAGILVKVGWSTIDWRFLTRIRHIERGYTLVMLITVVLTVFVDLMTAVALGFIAAGIAQARDSERLELDSVVSTPLLDLTFFPDREGTDELDPYVARVGLVALRGRFSVASASALVRVIGTDIQEHEVVIFDFSDTTYVDDSAALVIEQLIGLAADEDTECIVMNLSGPVASTLHSLNVLSPVPKHHFVDGPDEARRVAKSLLESRDGQRAPA